MGSAWAPACDFGLHPGWILGGRLQRCMYMEMLPVHSVNQDVKLDTALSIGATMVDCRAHLISASTDNFGISRRSGHISQGLHLNLDADSSEPRYKPTDNNGHTEHVIIDPIILNRFN